MTAKIQQYQYPKHRSSGVDWLGDIPANWKIFKFKELFRASNERLKDDPSVNTLLSVSGYRGVELKDISSMEGQMPSEDVSEYRIVRRGQLAVNTMWLNYAGLGVSEYEGYISPAYCAYFIKPNIDNKFTHYLLRSPLYVQKYTSLLYGVRPNSLQVKPYDFEHIEILLPPFETQKRIADFLDERIKTIDELIKKKEKLIEFLREKRAALITRAVTKGLNPNAKLKPSGIDWLGDIPAEWEVKKIKFVAKLYTGNSISDDRKPEFSIENDGYPYISSKDIDVNYSTINYENVMYIPKNSKEFKVAPADSILLCVEGGSAGRKIAYTDRKVCFVNKLCCITSKKMSNRYIFYFCRSKNFQDHFELSTSGLIGGVSTQRLKDFFCIQPTKSEQKQIVDYLDAEITKIDKAVALIEAQVEKLKEYRSSLIYHIVTGKVKV